MKKKILIDVLNQEIEKSTGCTDPGSVAFAVARAVGVLNDIPDKINVIVSPNIYKNGISVGIPGTGKRGLYQAAALGIYLADWTNEDLGILDHVNEEMVNRAQKILESNIINVSYQEDLPDPLYVKADVYKGGDQAWTVIQNDYSNVVEEGKNKKVLFKSPVEKKEGTVDELIKFDIADIIATIKDMDSADFKFLVDAAMVNKAAAQRGLKDNKTRMGSVLFDMIDKKSFPYSGMSLGKFYTASAAEARMIGLNVPIMAIAGSGNHGITNFLGILAASEALETDTDKMARALAISSAITIYIKGHIKRMTAFCGCSVAAATGVAAGTVYLLGGDYEDMVNAMHSVIGALAGVVCDGAKESCAYKLSTATSTAIEYAYLAKEKQVYIPEVLGIVSNTIEDTFEKLGKLNNPGMVYTDKCLLEIIQDIQSR